MNPPPGPEQPPSPFQPPPVGSYGGAGYGPYGGPGMAPRAAPPASSEAVAALVCGIMAWSCFPIGFVAIWLGIRARRAARENPNYVGGEQMALAGMIIGGFFGVLGLLLIVAYMALFVFAAGFGLLHK